MDYLKQHAPENCLRIGKWGPPTTIIAYVPGDGGENKPVATWDPVRGWMPKGENLLPASFGKISSDDFAAEMRNAFAHVVEVGKVEI